MFLVFALFINLKIWNQEDSVACRWLDFPAPQKQWWTLHLRTFYFCSGLQVSTFNSNLNKLGSLYIFPFFNTYWGQKNKFIFLDLFLVIQNFKRKDNKSKFKNKTNYSQYLDEKLEVLFQQTISSIVLSHIIGLLVEAT